MKKELKDYVPFYLGCECITPDGIMVLNRIDTTDVRYSVWFYCKWNDKKNCYLPKQNGEILGKQSLVGKAYKYSDIKLVLRPLSDMTEEEKKEFLSIIGEPQMYRDGFFYLGEYGFLNIRNNNITTSFGFNPESIKYLLSKHFDIFGLIEAGLAVNAAELKTITE